MDSTGLYKELVVGKTRLGLVGLGYVGMPIAVAFARYVPVVGYDYNEEKIENYKRGIDPTREVGDSVIKKTSVEFTADPSLLAECKFIVVAVPTPVNTDKTPDLTPVISASETVGKYMQPGTVVVYESTVYPGVTEEVCLPILERESGLKCGEDFAIGYSPERINPGDKVHRLENIRKIVSGMDAETCDTIKKVYDLVIEVGTYPVSTIKTAEAIKVVENSQRDVNIAFVNELAMAFARMGIDTNEVIDGMNTKWNALGFRPGLVGGHCIGVDPYYFTYEAEKLGYHSQIILAGRRINDGMGAFIADAAIKELVRAGRAPRLAHVMVLGITFKENCPDIRNSKVVDIINRLHEYDIYPSVADPWADPEEVKKIYGLELTQNWRSITDVDCLILAVAHKDFKKLPLSEYAKMFEKHLTTPTPGAPKIIIDVKGLLDRKEVEAAGFVDWRL